MLKTSINVVKEYSATQAVAYASLFVSAGWMLFWIYTVIMAQKFSRNMNYFLAVFLIFSFYWTFQVIKNVVHVTVSGLFATWYFMYGTVGMPPNPTLKSFKRATTTSFGSICLGSMIVALIQTLRAIVRSLRSDTNYFIICIVDCILGCLDNLVQYFNHYAYCRVAIYGESFCEAAKATWRLFKETGIDAIVNDNLIGGVLTTGCLLSAFLCAVPGGYIAHNWIDSHQVNEGDFKQYWLVMGLVGACIGFIIMSLIMQVVDSGVATIFVSFAEDKEALRRNHPDLYDAFRITYGEAISI